MAFCEYGSVLNARGCFAARKAAIRAARPGASRDEERLAQDGDDKGLS
jgi:hypothetical protein